MYNVYAPTVGRWPSPVSRWGGLSVDGEDMDGN